MPRPLTVCEVVQTESVEFATNCGMVGTERWKEGVKNDKLAPKRHAQYWFKTPANMGKLNSSAFFFSWKKDMRHLKALHTRTQVFLLRQVNQTSAQVEVGWRYAAISAVHQISAI